MTEPTTSHRPWCAPGCAAAITGVHASARATVGQTDELIGITIGLEHLTEPPTVDLVVLEFTEEEQPVEYRLPVRQARVLTQALRDALHRLATD